MSLNPLLISVYALCIKCPSPHPSIYSTDTVTKEWPIWRNHAVGCKTLISLVVLEDGSVTYWWKCGCCKLIVSSLCTTFCSLELKTLPCYQISFPSPSWLKKKTTKWAPQAVIWAFCNNYTVMFLLTTKNRFLCPRYMKVGIEILGFQRYQLLFYPFLVMHCSYLKWS